MKRARLCIALVSISFLTSCQKKEIIPESTNATEFADIIIQHVIEESFPEERRIPEHFTSHRSPAFGSVSKSMGGVWFEGLSRREVFKKISSKSGKIHKQFEIEFPREKTISDEHYVGISFIYLDDEYHIDFFFYEVTDGARIIVISRIIPYIEKAEPADTDNPGNPP